MAQFYLGGNDVWQAGGRGAPIWRERCVCCNFNLHVESIVQFWFRSDAILTQWNELHVKLNLNYNNIEV